MNSLVVVNFKQGVFKANVWRNLPNTVYTILYRLGYSILHIYTSYSLCWVTKYV